MEFPPDIATAVVRAYFCFDVADTIDLTRFASIRGGVDRAPLQLRPAASTEFLQFAVPPLAVRLPEDPAHPGVALRAKFFDYGVVSIRLSFPYAGDWTGFAGLAREVRAADVAAAARAALDRLMPDLLPVLDDPHEALVEDYYIFRVDEFVVPVRAATLLSACGPALTQLLLGEERPLEPTQQQESLRVNFTYYDDDLTVVQWDTAFVYDRADAAGATEDILEFANTQLVELRTYDAHLDAELDQIYRLDHARPARRYIGRRSAENAAQVRYLLVDVLELSDRASNALKFIGDAYYARLYRGVAGRLGLADWQRQIADKIASVGEMYRVFQDRAQHARTEMLELIVIVLIAVEIVLGLISLRH